MAPSRVRLEVFAQALATGKTPVEAAEAAGYPKGSSFANNARKRASRKDVKEIVAELQKPVKEKLAKTIEANFEWATKQLLEVGNLPIGIAGRGGKTRWLPAGFAVRRQCPQTRTAERRQGDGRRTAKACERETRQDNRGLRKSARKH